MAATMTPIYQERRQPGPKGKPAKDKNPVTQKVDNNKEPGQNQTNP
jgi:hypothetical protein